MPEEQNPSQEEPRGVFDSIKDGRSQASDAIEEPGKATETTAPTEPVKTGETESEKPDDRAELDLAKKEISRLKQHVAQRDRKLVEQGPYAQFGMAVAGDPKKGKQVVDRYQSGKPLFEETTSYEVENNEETPPLTLEAITDAVDQKLDQREGSRALQNELNTIAEENLPDFKKISRNPKFLEFHAAAQSLVWNNKMPIDDSVVEWRNDYAAKEYSAMKKAHSMFLADSPEWRKAVEDKEKLEKQEQNKALSSVPSSEGTTTSSQEEREESSEPEDIIKRMMSVNTRRKSFSTVGSKK